MKKTLLIISTMLIAMTISTTTAFAAFSDVNQSNKNYDAILYLQSNGIINGYSNGTFKPELEINRAELLKILVEGVGITPDALQYKDCFTDVTTEWFAPYACYAKSANWIMGYQDGSFKPAQTVTKSEALKMVLNTQEVPVPEAVTENPFTDVDSTQWYAPFVYQAKQLGFLEETGTLFNPSENMTRGSVSENVYRALKYLEENGTYPEVIKEDHIAKDPLIFQDPPSFITSNDYSTIKDHCTTMYPDSTANQSTCRQEQYQAFNQMLNPNPEYVTDTQYAFIYANCTNISQTDFVLQNNCFQEQYAGVEQINSSAASDETKTQCALDYPRDYTQQASCLQQ